MHRLTLPVALILLAGCSPSTEQPADTESLERPGRVRQTLEEDKAEEAEHLTGKVVSVADGDTLTVLVDQREVKVRVHGIDCPETGQPFGTKAKQFTSGQVFGKVVSVKVIETDRDGLTVGRVILPSDVDLSALLVEHGMAWHYVKNASDDEQLAALVTLGVLKNARRRER